MGNEFNQGVTFKIYPQAHLRADHLNTIYLRVTIARRKKEFNLKVYWPAEFFDDVTQSALPRKKNDVDVAAVNMVITEAKSRANRIRMRYFGENRVMTLDTFAKEFENYENRENFLFYWEKKISEREAANQIGEPTARRHRTNLKRFKDFTGEYVFYAYNDITADLVMKYQAWLRKKMKYNTVVGSLKALKTYLNCAMDDGFKLEDPFAKLPLNYNAGEREVLDRQEIKRLQALFIEEGMDETMREVLRKFLFSCFTGLRISDTHQISRRMITGKTLRVKLVKGRNFGKSVQILLPDYALSLIEGRNGLIFKYVPDKTCNEWLKIIAGACKPKIDKHLTFHVSRDTFATLFIEMGGDVFTLKELMGHSDIKTTMIYVKMSENRRDMLMGNFNNL
ncbi:MAG: site-specific integrase [Bacteroidota bacterium]